MILKFPDLDTLRIALINGAAPAAAWGSPAVAGLDEDGALWIDTPAALSKTAQAELKQLGVQTAKKNGAAMCANVSCWLEMLPLVRTSESLAPPEQTPVLFDLPNGQQLARMATEILRLGNDRQTFRWLEEPAKRKTDGNVRALLRVVGPPYYSLLRALDAQGPDAPRAFVERARNVWVQLGYTHPLGEHLKAPPGQMLLLRPPRQWIHLPDAPFRDIYEVLEFSLPGTPVGWKEGEVGHRLKVPLTLARGGTTEAAELWVLRDDPVNELNNLVQNADDQLLGRLSFAVGEHNGKKTIVLRVRPSRLPPPVLVVRGESFRHFLKLPNLFVPCGWRLHPPLRRDVVRSHLADDPNVLTWLYPAGGGQFVAETLAADAFRPLSDWIDYVVEHDKAHLQTWVQSAQFDFESFVCNEDEPSRPRKPPGSEKGQKPRGGKGGAEEVELPTFKMAVKAGKKPEEVEELDDFANLTKNEPSANQMRLRELEDQFVSFEGTLDAPERQQLWPELAAVNSALANTEDAGICWANALWSQEEMPPAWVWKWFCAEANAVKPEENGRGRVHSWASPSTLASGSRREVSGDDLDRLLEVRTPSYADARSLAVYLMWAARCNPRPDALMQRLNAVQRFLEANEGRMTVRAAWLAWVSFVQLTGGDVLALARARDRLLERLFRGGLRPEQDLPSFLRFSGQPTSQRFRAVRSWMLDLCKQAHVWSKAASTNLTSDSAKEATHAYINLMFAYGLARMGEADASRELLGRAKETLGAGDTVHQFLLEAFDFRIRLARDGKKNTGPLPPEQMEFLEKAIVDKMQHYVVERMRRQSRILEPDQKIDPYRRWTAKTSELESALAVLADLTDREEVKSRVRKLLGDAAKGNKGAEVKAKILDKALAIAPCIGEEFALDLLAQLGPVYDALPQVRETIAVIERSGLLEKALFVAAHFDRKDHIQALVARFHRLLQEQRGNSEALKELNPLVAQCFRGLRKLGMREEIDFLLKEMADIILEGRDVAAVGAAGDRNWPAALMTLLHVAAGWLYFGKDRQAEPVLNAARKLLFEGELLPKDQTPLACAYATAVGLAPVEVAQKRLEELFHRLTGIKDSYTSSSHYSRSQLDLVEAVVLAVVSDDHTMGANARRWLDDDEFIVRRRIHREFQAIKAQAHA